MYAHPVSTQEQRFGLGGGVNSDPRLNFAVTSGGRHQPVGVKPPNSPPSLTNRARFAVCMIMAYTVACANNVWFRQNKQINEE